MIQIKPQPRLTEHDVRQIARAEIQRHASMQEVAVSEPTTGGLRSMVVDGFEVASFAVNMVAALGITLAKSLVR
ncbi:hypothetical protein [Rhodococcus tibetensis]|uniref:Uncharacterized protein n=1 Tax=Rhodococcus tibetensis TaxID=2965064 RepID=A0ABT1QC64_9NOCA|nr:hypothetical protein [Rhodococcus sp. FXJ9.536]MCQ4119853.1 hypothetical protein [Rhodococcus sp. FXJ9.536]